MSVDKTMIAEANKKAIERMQTSEVVLEGIVPAQEAIPFLAKGRAVAHAGPPLAWEKMRDTMRGAICGAAVFEGWAHSIEEAWKLAESGGIQFGSCNDLGCIGPLCGITSPSMPVFALRNTTFGNRAYVVLSEGGVEKTLRYGANGPAVVKQLAWVRDKAAPVLAEAIKLAGPVDITDMAARGIQRGDECHNRNKASTSIFIRHMAAYMARTSFSKDDIANALAYMDSDDSFFLCLSLGYCKATMDSISGIEHSTVVSCMCTNGDNFGLKVAGTGNQWFLAPSPKAIGRYFDGYTEDDASTTMGDSYISETAGIGAFAMAAALGMGQSLGISTKEAQQFSLDMYTICLAENQRFKIPGFDFRGTPTGIDVRRVLASKTLPVIDTGIAHKEPGVGHIGVGVVYPPIACFEQALSALNIDKADL